ncbi:MAG: hypothetical protein WCF17_04810 [Terracidiphilus sp.]
MMRRTFFSAAAVLYAAAVVSVYAQSIPVANGHGNVLPTQSSRTFFGGQGCR